MDYESANDVTEPSTPPDRRKIPTLITRLWRGWTTVDNADAYERFLLGEPLPSMRQIPGFRGADILRRLEHNEVAFTALTRFDSVAAIQVFAGDDYETPVLELKRSHSAG